MANPLFEYKNIIIGNTKSGKSTLINFLNGEPLRIQRNSQTKKFEIEANKDRPVIGNDAVSMTIESNKLGNFIDQPGLNTNNDAFSKCVQKISIFDDLKKTSIMKFLLVISSESLYSNNSDFFLKSLNDVLKTYNFEKNHLKSIHVVFSRYQSDENRNPLQFIQDVFSGYDNLIVKGLLENKISFSVWHEPINDIFDENEKIAILNALEALCWVENSGIDSKSLEKMICSLAIKGKNTENINSVYKNQIQLVSDLLTAAFIVSDPLLLIINEDLHIVTENLIIDHRMIIVMGTHTITITGSESTCVVFGENIEYFINEKDL